MKLRKSLFKLTFFFILIFGIHSCSNDELILDSEKPNHEKLSLDKFKQEILSKLAPKDPVLNNLQNGNKHQSSSKNSSLSIELIDREILKKISAKGLETYVIPVSTNDSDSRPHYYQLILITQNDKWDYKLLKFLPTITNIKIDKRSKYEGTIEVIPFSSSQISNREDACQAYIVESEVYIPCIRHTGYHPDCWGGTWETRFDIVIECGSGGGGEPFIDGGGGSSYEGDTTGTPTYGGGSWTASPTSPTQTVYTGPIPVYYDTEAESQKLYERFLYGADLSTQQKDYLSQHKDVSDAVKNYLYTNNYTSEAKEFVKQLINLANTNPHISIESILYSKTDFDVNNSLDIDNNVDGGYDNTTYADFNPQQTWSNISPIIPSNQFVGWGASGIRRNCMDYAKAQIAKLGYQISNYGAPGQTIQIYTEQNGVTNSNLLKGLSYLKYALSNNIPVIVGVDDKPGNPGNPDGSTDHFVVIIGMGNNSTGNYFQFYDNASGNTTQGTSPLNLLYYNPSTGQISGSSQCSGYFGNVAHNYIITQIRKSKRK